MLFLPLEVPLLEPEFDDMVGKVDGEVLTLVWVYVCMERGK